MTTSRRRNLSRLRHMIIWAMLGALMFLSKILLDALPNIHMIGMLLMVYTLVYRWGALVPLYVFVLLTGLYGGFNSWWGPYLYIWTVLWAITMLLPRRMPPRVAAVVYVIVCSLHGLCFGILYAPYQALMYGLDWQGTLAWIAGGLYFDVYHAIGNFVFGTMILPLSNLLRKLENMSTIT